jgi:beta-lactamase superfamily II metal-dependent hydrolase
MAKPVPLPNNRFRQADFFEQLRASDLVYFLCNVGDADAQLILLPEFGEASEQRRAIIIDAGRQDKLPQLLDSLIQESLLPSEDDPQAVDSIPLVVATHPHSDHIGGIHQLLELYGPRVTEFWDPGYYHTTPHYHDMMRSIEHWEHLVYAQPTSGLRRWIGNVAVTVLSPSIQLRNRFDTYGTEINDSSISLRVEYPASRVVERDNERRLIVRGRTTAMVLGADAQTLSWSYVAVDFPQLHTSHSAAAKAIKAATGVDLLRGKFLKVPHHASKHGVNIELIERINPTLTFVSCSGGSGSYGFPHTLAQDVIREAIQRTASSDAERKKDHELGIFYTSDVRGPRKDILGSMAIVVRSNGDWVLWRFGDSPSGPIDFTSNRTVVWKRA